MAAPGFTSAPPMGYNTWYAWRTGITEAELIYQALLMIDTGLYDAGYNSMNLDDAWSETTRRADGTLFWDSNKFPDGMPCFCNKLHELGFNAGIYTAIGEETCQHYPASYGHYAQDARAYADWGIDMVKVDLCGVPAGYTIGGDTTITLFEEFGTELYNANPNVIYSQELPIGVIGTADFVPHTTAGAAFSNMWRVAHDLSTSEYRANFWDIAFVGGFYDHITQTKLVGDLSAPWKWNDLDMIAPNYGAGVNDWTLTDLQAQLGTWAMFASPLLISCDLDVCGQDAIDSMKNPWMIAIDQSGGQATSGLLKGNVQAYWKDTSVGHAILFINMGTGSTSSVFSLAELGMTGTIANYHEVWPDTDGSTGLFSIGLAANTTRLIVVTSTS